MAAPGNSLRHSGDLKGQFHENNVCQLGSLGDAEGSPVSALAGSGAGFEFFSRLRFLCTLLTVKLNFHKNILQTVS